MARKSGIPGPIRRMLLAESSLLGKVEAGMGAIEREHRRDCFHEEVRTSFADSLEIDKNLADGRHGQHRWDYLLGHAASQSVIAVEPHPARHDEISVVIMKKDRAREQLRDHLAAGAKIVKWIWVGSGRNGFVDTDKVRRQLDQRGIEFVCAPILKKHLPAARAAPRRRRK